MTTIFKTFATTLGLITACATASLGDGIDPVYRLDGSFIDDIEIIGDVTGPDGETYAVLEMKSEYMRFYVDPDAIYVMMERDNPIIVDQKQFKGFWLNTQTIDNTNWPACAELAEDEHGNEYQAYGHVIWTNTAIADDDYRLEFYIDIGACDDPVQEWGLSGAALERINVGNEVDGDPTPPLTFDLTDANNRLFEVFVTPHGTGLVTYDGSEDLTIYDNCSAFSPQRGWGSWSWANGGFFIDYASASFSFPRMDAPIENGGGCRL